MLKSTIFLYIPYYNIKGKANPITQGTSFPTTKIRIYFGSAKYFVLKNVKIKK